jgi:hypothetical protein
MERAYMDSIGFRESLQKDENIIGKVKAVNSRITKAISVENIFTVNLDDVVNDDILMKELLIKIKDIDTNGVKGNAVRKYYKFKNGRIF